MNPRNHEKPYSEACERNREPILAVLREAGVSAAEIERLSRNGIVYDAVQKAAHA